MRLIPSGDIGQSGTGTVGLMTASGCVMKWMVGTVLRKLVDGKVAVVPGRA